VKKTLTVAVAALTAAAALTACSPAGKDSGSAQKSGDAKTITVWTSYLEPEMKAYTATFEKDHPGVKVNVKMIAGPDLKAKIQSGLVTKTLPDVFQWWSGSALQPIVASGNAQDLTSDIDSDAAWKDSFQNDAFDSFVTNGKTYGVPLDHPTTQLYLNNKVLASAGISAGPATFDELLTDVAKLKAKGVIPITVDGKDGWPMEQWIAFLAMRNGADIYSALKGQEDFNSAPYIEAGKQLRQLIDAGAFQSGFLGDDIDAAQANFLGGRAGMILSGSWLVPTLNMPENKKALANTSFVSFPSTGGTGEPTEMQGGPNGSLIVSSHAGNTKLAWEWVKGMASAKTSSAIATSGLNMVPTKITYDRSSVPDIYNKLVDALPTFSSYNLFWNSILPPEQNTEFTNLMNALAAGKTTPEKMMADFSTYMKANPVAQ
jgi:raffinose/stachyose/melibiose transport system substrate-binding protein